MKLLSAFSIVILTAASSGALLAENQVLLRNLDIGDHGTAQVLVTDNSGNLFAFSSVTYPSGKLALRIIKTDPNGTPLASLDFPASSSSGSMDVSAAATDSQGNLVFVGAVGTVLVTSDFPLVNPLFPSDTTGGAFVMKLDSQLHRTLFSTFLNPRSNANAVTLDSAGNIYIAGGTAASDFPITAGAYQPTPPNCSGNASVGCPSYAFLMEISPNGDRLLYSTYFGGNSVSCRGGSVCVGVAPYTQVLALATGPAGAVAMAGQTTAGDLPVTPGALGGPGCGASNLSSTGFVAVFSQGTPLNLAWSTCFDLGDQIPCPACANKFVDTVAFDPAGDVIVGGLAELGLPTTPGVLQPALTEATYYGGFVGKVTGSGTKLAWMTWFGGSPQVGGVDIGFQSHVAALAVDSQGQIVMTGTSEPNQLPPFPGTPAFGVSYVARLSSDGSALQQLYAGPNNAAGAGLVLTPTGTFVSLGPAGMLWIETPASGPSLLAIANAADGPVSGVVSPAEIISLYGLGIGPPVPVQGQAPDGVYLSSLGGYQVLFDGVPAPLLYAGPTQINAVVPQAVSYLDYSHVQIVTPSVTVDGPALAVQEAEPYICQYSPATPAPDGTSMLAAALNQDGSFNSPQNPAKPGQIVIVFASGGGVNLYSSRPDGTVVSDSTFQNSILPVAVLYNQSGSTPTTSLEVLYAGDAPEMVLGAMQVNFRLPESLPPSFTYRFSLQVGNVLGGSAAVAVSSSPATQGAQ